MSKRKRTDFEGGIQTAGGTAYGSVEVDGADISYDDAKSSVGGAIVAAPAQERKQVSYDPDADEPTPAGPYSYAKERKEQIYYSGADNERGGAREDKRPRREKWKDKPQVDERFGQYGAFPKPENDEWEGDAAGGSENMPDAVGGGDAWEYLQSVRQEAEGLPDIFHKRSARDRGPGKVPTYDPESDLHPQDRDREEEIDCDYQGDYDEDIGELHDEHARYANGVCWAAPQPIAPEKTLTAQDLYYKVLCKRFQQHRSRMTSLRPDQKDTSPTDPRVPKSMHALTRRVHQHHGRTSLLRVGAPSMQLIASLDDRDTLKILTFLDEDIDEVIGAGRNLPESFGTWAWFLLGRLGDAGGLSGEQIGVVRDLAKRAGWALAALKIAVLQRSGVVVPGLQKVGDAGGDDVVSDEARTRALRALEEVEDGEVDEDGDGDGAGIKEDVPNDSTLALLHLIITVAGEFYGQRDLLDSRLPWID